MTSSCSLPSNTSKTATENDLQARIARWVERKKAVIEAEKLFKEDDRWMTEARENGLLDEYFDQLAFEDDNPPTYRYDCPGVTFEQCEMKRWGERHYPKELQDSIKAFKDNNECPPTFYWKAKLK